MGKKAYEGCPFTRAKKVALLTQFITINSLFRKLILRIDFSMKSYWTPHKL